MGGGFTQLKGFGSCHLALKGSGEMLPGVSI